MSNSNLYYDNYGYNSSIPSIPSQMQHEHDPSYGPRLNNTGTYSQSESYEEELKNHFHEQGQGDTCNHCLTFSELPRGQPPPSYNMTGGGGGDATHSAATLLSWRKLHLSRAKLKAINKTSALMSGFAMVAMVEMQLSADTKVPSGLLVAFVICTSLLVAVHMLALMISTCILPNVEAISNLHNINIVEESPHERMHWYIEAGWAFSTVLGIFLFLCELAILCWVKFYDHSIMAASSATIIMVPVLILFMGFAVHFYHKLVVHKYELTESGLRELEQLKIQLDSTVTSLVSNSNSPSRNNISIV